MAKLVWIDSISQTITHSNVPFTVPDGVAIIGRSTLSVTAVFKWSGFDGSSYGHRRRAQIYNSPTSSWTTIFEDWPTTTAKSGTKTLSGSIAISDSSIGALTPGSTILRKANYNIYPYDESNPYDTDDMYITVAEWAEPVITSYSVNRATATGEASNDGTKIRYSFSATTKPLTGYGSAEYFLRYKKTEDTTWTEVPVSEDVLSINQTNVEIDGDFPLNESYVFQFVAYDGYVSAIAQQSVPSGGALMHFNATKDGVGIGKYSESPGLDVALDSRFRGVSQFDTAPTIATSAQSAFMGGFAPCSVLSNPTAETVTYSSTSRLWFIGWQTKQNNGTIATITGGLDNREFGWIIPEDGFYEINLFSYLTSSASSNFWSILYNLSSDWTPTTAANYTTEDAVSSYIVQQVREAFTPINSSYAFGQISATMYCEKDSIIFPTIYVSSENKAINATSTRASIRRVG